MSAMRKLLGKGLLGVLLAYVLAAQALLAGPTLAASFTTAHELCVTGEDQPAAPSHHAGVECCLAAQAAPPFAIENGPTASFLPMRIAVPFVFAARALPSQQIFARDHAQARAPPQILV